jgi:hypothetical protein
MSVPKLMTGIFFVFAVGGMGYGAFAVLAQDSPREAAAQSPAAIDHSVVARSGPGHERIESPRECRHESGIHNACTHL